MLNEFIAYLNEQIGQPYLWGGQHLKLTPDNYEEVIHQREDGRGEYKDGTTYADAAIAFCEKKFAEGATELFAYDCSGLGMYWIENLQHIWPHDASANTMMGHCTELDSPEPPEKGWWVFKTNSNGKATHIGYMIDNEYLIEAKGRKYGVVKTKWKESAWSCWGIPDIFYDEIVNPEPDPPVPPEPPVTDKVVYVVAKSVFVRKGDGILSRIMFTAHKGNHFKLIDIAPSGWYHIMTYKGEGYITNKEKYTKLVET